jgi:hypothetical protein
MYFAECDFTNPRIIFLFGNTDLNKQIFSKNKVESNPIQNAI